jgi:hypothetical protein
MILEQLGILCDAGDTGGAGDGACADADGYIGYCLDLATAIGELGATPDIWLVLSTAVAASYADADETYEFQLHGGTATDGTNINTGAVIIESTTALAGDDARYATAGEYIWRHTLDYYAGTFQYLQLYYAQTGTTNTITIDFSISPTKPPSKPNVQREFSNVTTP